MSHHIYTTPGFIIHSSSQGEAGKFFLVFTRDLGMIGATAQGVRLSKSKLKYYVQDYSRNLFSFVRGKEMWRMTGAKEIDDAGEIKDMENKKLYVRVLLLLRRLLSGEEKNEKLFEVMEGFYKYLCSSTEKRELLEYLTVLRMLHMLGYTKKTFENLLTGAELNDEIFDEVQKSKSLILKEINNGLKESQL